jgi:hypothetical protein
MKIDLDDEQKAWYASRYAVQSEDMWREYPSTPDESWQVSNEGLYYSKHMSVAQVEGRIGRIPHEEALNVYTAWDLGYNDSTAIWFFQVYGKEIRLIDYVEGSDSLQHWIGVVKSKPYIYEKHLAPHDCEVHEYSTGITRLSYARKMGINFVKVKKSEIITGIDQVKNMLNRCWFDEKKCAQGIRCLENYKKDWDDRNACWRSQPLHNWASHGADAFRTLATGLHFVGNTSQVDTHNPMNYMKNRFGS